MFDKITFKEVNVLAAIDNDAAHNSASLLAADVSKMRVGGIRLLQKFSN